MSYQKNWPTWLAYSVAVIVFGMVASYALLYATGYRLNFQDWSLHKTGVLAITTKPSGARVLIDDKKYGKTTPITVRNMLPGTYTIKLELEHYQPFTKTVEIVSSQVTEEHNLDLVLEQPETKVVAENITRVLGVGNEIMYFSKDRKIMKTTGNEPGAVVFDRLPANVKSVLTAATDVYLAQKSSGNTWVLGVNANGRKWLVAADFQEGYRGQLFGAPLNQIPADKLTWIDNDRFMGMVGTALYIADMNLNRVNQYAKNILGASYQNGKLYYVVRGTDGGFQMMRDGNISDDKLGEVWMTDLPVAKSYDIIFTNDERNILVAHNSAAGLWLWEKTDSKNELASPSWHKVASGIGEVWYEHHNQKPKMFYTIANNLVGYDFKDKVDVGLHRFDKAAKLLGKTGETLLISSGGVLYVSDTSGNNVYKISDIASNIVFWNGDSKRLWILSGGTLTEWVLRGNDTNIFGGLTNFWSNPAAGIVAG